MLRKYAVEYIGAFLGVLTYVALLFSPLASKLDSFLHGYYKYAELIDEKSESISSIALILGGILTIFTFCYIYQSDLSFWKKISLFVVGIVITVLWSPVLVVWNIIWSPVLILIAILWSLICSQMIKRFLPVKQSVAHNESLDFYTVDTDI